MKRAVSEVDEQRRKQDAFMVTLTKQQLTFDLKNTSIDSKPGTPDSDTEQLMRLGVWKFPWHPASERAMIADKADEECEPETPDSFSKLMNKVNAWKSLWHGRHPA